MRKRNTESLGEVLKQFFEENLFFKKKLAESRIISGWAQILGKTVDSYTSGLYIRGNILHVQLTSSVLRAELIMGKEPLIEKLNKHAGIDIINDIVFK